jgi:hypothetical protein
MRPSASELRSAKNLPCLRFPIVELPGIELGTTAAQHGVICTQLVQHACSLTRGTSTCISERIFWSVWAQRGRSFQQLCVVPPVWRSRSFRTQTPPTPDPLYPLSPVQLVHVRAHHSTRPVGWWESGIDSMLSRRKVTSSWRRELGYSSTRFTMHAVWAALPELSPRGADDVLTRTRYRLSSPVSRPDAVEKATRARPT